MLCVFVYEFVYCMNKYCTQAHVFVCVCVCVCRVYFTHSTYEQMNKYCTHKRTQSKAKFQSVSASVFVCVCCVHVFVGVVVFGGCVGLC